ncbi:hypothetical protein H920_20351 [Fukomys damarensis]|uniref:Uncharacterized protein n=1 Tax=Fukomys damarensis TaxID=885580 RepID=A0A091CLM2_FUKDA|nr:hypothetical protein H920_20351 [Fukomys damarensis]
MVFLRRSRLFSLEEELGAFLLLGMAAAFIRGVLIFTMNNTSWLQCGSLSLLAQILHRMSTDFLASTTGLWAFQVQILKRDTAMGSRPLAGLKEDTALDCMPLVGLVWDTAGIQALR